jgi:hypothetical protein
MRSIFELGQFSRHDRIRDASFSSASRWIELFEKFRKNKMRGAPQPTSSIRCETPASRRPSFSAA